jgi:hypothetical protein
MRKPPATPIALLALALLAGVALAQSRPDESAAEAARANFARPIELAPDDVRAFDDPPSGFNAERPDVPHGTLDTL